jgi:transcriptional regulator with XRE-family HTH domain
MGLHQSFAQTLKLIRKSKQLTQEDFSVVSSRTYLSTLERGLKSPTLDKVQELTEVLGIHPLTLLTMTYMQLEDTKLPTIIEKIRTEIGAINLQITGY